MLANPPLNVGAYNLTVLLNDGTGNFSTPIRSEVLNESYFAGDFALGNFRNTGRPDFLSIGQGQQYTSGAPYLAFAKNNGDGTFSPMPLTTPAGAQGLLGVGDFNRDGKLDFVTVENVFTSQRTWTSTLSVFLGNGDGTFTSGYTTTFNPSAASNYPVQVWVGDFNGDGKLDVLAQMGSTGEGTQGNDVYEFLGNGDGTFAAGKVVLPNFGAMAVGDLNNDGIPDIVEIVEPLNTLADGIPLQYAIYLGQTDGSFKLTNTYQPYTGNLASLFTQSPGVMLADFNGDGNLDIAAIQAVPGYDSPAFAQPSYVQIMTGNGDGTFTPTYNTSNFNEYLVPQLAADLNGDGKADLILLAGYGSSFHVIPATVGPSLQIGLETTPIVGSTDTAQVTIAVPSSTSTAIQLTASDPAISIPASVSIPAGSVSADVPVRMGSAFNTQHVFSLQATLGTQTSTTYGWEASSAVPVGFQLLLANFPQTILPSETTTDYGVQVFSISGYSTTVKFSCTGLPTWATCQFGSPTALLPAGDEITSTLVVATTSAGVGGNYPFTVVATGGTVTSQATATLQIGDFAIIITPASQTAPTTGTATYNLTVNPINNFAGQVNVTLSGLPSGASATSGIGIMGANPSPVTLNIATDNVAAGSYLFKVSGRSGTLTRSATATLVVQVSPDFTLGINPTSAAVTAGQSTNFGLTLDSKDGLTGGVSLQCSNLPSGATCGFNPASPTLTSNASMSDTLTVQVSSTVAAGNYPFSVTATSGSLTHTVSATVQVQVPPGLSGSVSPTSASITVGQSANFTVTVNSQNGAAGTVNLQCAGLPSGTTCAFNPSAPTLPANGSVSDTLTVQVNSMPAASPPAPPWQWPHPRAASAHSGF